MDSKYGFLTTLLATILILWSTSAEANQTTPADNLCQNVTCAENEECQLVEVTCIRAPCNPQPKCVASTPKCSALMDCTLNCSNGRVKDASGCERCECRVCDPNLCAGMICLHGRVRDRDGCIMCDCNQPCFDVTCPDGYSCEPRKNSTTNEYFGQCVAIATRPQCDVYNCSNFCRFGYKIGNSGCQIGCQCYEPCENYPCPANKQCMMTPDCPQGEECRDGPMPYCADISDHQSTVSLSSLTTSPPQCSVLMDCTLNCSNGRVKDASGCETCECRICDQNLCAGMSCLYGRARDRDGCIVCRCNEPCIDFSCPEGHECQPVKNSTSGIYVGHCIQTETRDRCPTVNCSSSGTCRYGFKSDSEGCSTCECRDPCQNYYCPENQRCVMSADDCPVGAECRDAPMPHCIDSSTTTLQPTPKLSTTRARGERGDEGQEVLRQCCDSARMSESCLTVCATNITLLYSNSETLSACFQYLGDFLRCASGGRSHVNCCNQRGISESCLYLCSGNDTVDTSNLHAVTQCVLSSSQTVLGCFNEGLTDANVTVPSTSTPSSTTAEDVCSLAPEAGNCRALIEQWYYSAKDRACATFNYGGCGGNGNRFSTRDECLDRCSSRNGPLCPDIQCSASCQITVDQYGCHSCRCGNDCLSNGCPLNQECLMVPGSCSSNGTNCPLEPKCIGKPDVLCEPMANCSLSCPRGWMTDTRGCVICQCKDSPSIPTTRAPKPLLCQYAPDFGMSCQSNSTRWFYNQSANACSPFSFGGCQGNDNNFQSKQNCEEMCRDGNCPKLDCPAIQNCSYGLKTDETGCSVCQCLDPCENVSCPVGKVCMSQKMDCADEETCREPFTRVCVDPSSLVSTSTAEPRTTGQGCPAAVSCTMYCVHGFEKDSNGCNICECRDPCKNCTANQTCMGMTMDCPVNDPRCANSFINYCVDKESTTPSTTTTSAPTTTTSPFPSSTTPRRCLLCMMRCPYLMLKDSYGCPICRCYEPCELIDCDGNSTCQVFENDCSSDPDCPPNIRFRGKCVETTAVVSTTTSTPGNVTCSPRPRPVCAASCPYGNAKDSNGCYTCACDDPCERTTCNATEVCVRVSSTECIEDMCWPAYSAVCERNCSRPVSCSSVNCTYGLAKGADGCEICLCFDPCLNVTCDANQQCAVKSEYKCIGAKCGLQSVGYCAVRCPSMANCKISCEFGFAKDESDCKMCQCHDPCLNYPCENGETCVPSKFPILMGTPPERTYFGVCAVCTETMTCRMSCRYGLAKNMTTECDMCQCYEPCQNVTCRSGQVCRPKQEFNGRYPYVAECVETTTTTSSLPTTATVKVCPPVCRMYCDHGMVRDENGCEICKCIEPCKGVSCRANQKCVVTPLGNDSYTGQCVECPMPMCLGLCFYGTMVDEFGCPSCNCRSDPCSGYRCQDTDDVCQTLLFCPDSVCIPSTVCVDRRRPCDGLQKEYKKTFGNNVDKMPQLNCDSRGRFKPIQCSEYDCWCVDENGTPTTNRSSMTLNCYSGNLTKEKLKIEADFNVIQLGDGWRFKQQLSQQVANILEIDDSLVTIKKYMKGSIIAEVEIGSNANTDMGSVQNKLEMAKLVPFEIVYDNRTYEAIVLGGPTPSTPTPSMPTPVTSPPITRISTVLPQATSAGAIDNSDNKPSAATEHLLMIVLICVFVPIALVAIAVAIWLSCKIINNNRMNSARRLSHKSGISTEVDSLESGSDKSYSNEQFSSITKDAKIADVRDTTEA